jgi:hypothetical protein
MGKPLTIYVLFLEAVFVFSRGLFYAAGASFDTAPLYSFIQYIDPVLLRTRLFESLFYLHSQPPLFNLFLGILLKCVPHHFVAAANGIYLLLGQAMMFALFFLMVRLGVRPLIAFAGTAIFMVSPAVLLYENVLFYEYPAAVLMLWAGLWLHRFAETRRAFEGHMFFVTLALLGLLKSVFHLSWFMLIGAGVWAALKLPWRRMIAIAGIPLVILGGVYVKNLIVFGHPTLSHVMLAGNLLNMAANIWPQAQIKRLYDEGSISSTTAVAVLSPYDIFTPSETVRLAKIEIDRTAKTGIPILDRVRNETNAQYSIHSMLAFNNHSAYLKDALFLLRRDTKNYIFSLERSILAYFFPGPTDMTVANRKFIRDYEDSFNFPFHHLNRINGGELYEKYLLRWDSFHLLKWDRRALIWLSVVITLHIWAILFGAKRMLELEGENPKSVAPWLTLGFMLFNLVFVFAASVLVSWWGTNRYRFNVETFFWALFMLLLTRFLGQFRFRTRSHS